MHNRLTDVEFNVRLLEQQGNLYILSCWYIDLIILAKMQIIKPVNLLGQKGINSVHIHGECIHNINVVSCGIGISTKV